MKYLRKYNENVSEDLANSFISIMSDKYDLRLGKPFDKNKANCAWFTIEFYKWCKSKGLDVKVVYFDSDVEAHIAPMLDGKVVDFTIKQFTKNPNHDYKILTPNDYKRFGYNKFEIYDELPELETVFPADELQTYNENMLDDCKNVTGYTEQELKDIFELNLEDNTDFNVLNVKVFTAKEDSLSRRRVYVDLTEDFSDNQEFDNQYKNWNNNTRVAESPTSISYKKYVYDVNRKLIDVICKKYDLEICKDAEGSKNTWKHDIGLAHTRWNSTTEFDIRFTVSKIKTI